MKFLLIFLLKAQFGTKCVQRYREAVLPKAYSRTESAQNCHWSVLPKAQF